MSYKVLIIDDDQNLLLGLKRQFRKTFDLVIANGGEEGLKALKEDDSIAVIVSDMNMPGMNGLETLKAVRDHNPNTVRIMLTGNADQQTATNAVNEGEIFRFYSKPCEADDLAIGINLALKQHKLIVAEKELLEQTLAGTVKFLVDLLAFSKPIAFSRSTRIREWIKLILPKIRLEAAWRIDFAAMLLPLCDLIISSELEEKIDKNIPLSQSEIESLETASQTISTMLLQIPRISEIADIVGATKTLQATEDKVIPLEAKILIILEDLAKQTSSLYPTKESFEAILPKSNRYDSDTFALLQSIFLTDKEINLDEYEEIDIDLKNLRPNDLLVNDLISNENNLLLSAGTVLSDVYIKRLNSIIKSKKLSGTVRVMRTKSIS